MPSHSLQTGIVATAFDPDIRVAARAARAAGFAGIQLESRTAALDITALSITGRRELRHIISGQNLQLISLRVDLGGKGFGPSADIDAILARLDLIMQAAAGLAAPLLCIDAGPLPAPPNLPKPAARITSDQLGLLIMPPLARPAPDTMSEDRLPAALDPIFAASVDGALAELGRLADRNGVTIAFRSDLAAYAALDRALKAAACPWFGIDLDPPAMLRDAWPFDEIFSRLGNLIRHVRGRDALLGADRRTKPAPIGQGSVRWDDLLSSFDHAGYQGWITIDPVDLPDRPAAASAGLKQLRR